MGKKATMMSLHHRPGATVLFRQLYSGTPSRGPEPYADFGRAGAGEGELLPDGPNAS